MDFSFQRFEILYISKPPTVSTRRFYGNVIQKPKATTDNELTTNLKRFLSEKCDDLGTVTESKTLPNVVFAQNSIMGKLLVPRASYGLIYRALVESEKRCNAKRLTMQLHLSRKRSKLEQERAVDEEKEAATQIMDLITQTKTYTILDRREQLWPTRFKENMQKIPKVFQSIETKKVLRQEASLGLK